MNTFIFNVKKINSIWVLSQKRKEVEPDFFSSSMHICYSRLIRCLFLTFGYGSGLVVECVVTLLAVASVAVWRGFCLNEISVRH